MATFTIELYKICEIYDTPVARDTAIGLATYPIHNESYREGLNQKIVDHYWNREIGMETIQLFEFAMRRKMNEIMPYYKQLYETTELGYEALKTIDIHTKSTNEQMQESETEGVSATDSDNVSKSRAVSSETPQNALSGNADYATGANDVTSDTTVGATGTESSTGRVEGESSSDSTTSGYQGVPAELVNAYRNSLLNLDVMIINDLDECFMQVWDNGDELLPPNIRGYLL